MKKNLVLLSLLTLLFFTACAEEEALPSSNQSEAPAPVSESASESENERENEDEAPTSNTSSQAESILSQAQLDDYAAFVENLAAENDIAGGVVAVVQSDAVLLVHGFGYRNLEEELPVTPETLFHIGSTNKSMTALLVATLVDEGLLDWDTPLVEVWPDFELSDPASTDTVTMRHLLSMTSGLGDEAEDAVDLDDPASQVFDIAAEADLLGAPGTAYSYSNVATSLAGYIAVIVAQGESDDYYADYAALLTERVLTPSGMDGAVVYHSEALANPNYGLSYVWDDNEEALVVGEPEDFDGDPLAPSGVVKASGQDMAAYIRTQLRLGVAPDGTRVVSAENLRQTWQPLLENYGLGWQASEIAGVDVLAHEGLYDHYLSFIGFAPELDLGFVILTNSADTAAELLDQAPVYLLELAAE